MNELFRGTSSLSLDVKGRLTVPTRYRQDIVDKCDGNMIITADPDECLLLYPREEWLVVEQKIAALPTLNKQSRILQRFMIGHATDVEVDKNGRLLVPPTLRNFAGLDKQIMFVGQGKKFEIWDEARWHKNTQQWMEDIADKNELIGDLETLSF